MRAHSASVVTGIASVVVFSTSVLAAPAAKLAPDAIATTFFTGQPFTASTTSNVKFKMTFTADNKMKREPSKGGGGAPGRRHVEIVERRLLHHLEGTKANCFTIVPAGDNKWSVLKGSTILATWSK